VPPEALRLFVALELTEEVQGELAALVKRVKEAGGRGLRTVSAHQVHLTVKFLGDTPRRQVPALSKALEGATAGVSPFRLALGETGVFPPRGRARVLWVGLGGDLEALAHLHRRVEEALEPLGFPRERRPYTPHLTVARVRPGASPGQLARALEALREAPPRPLPLPVRTVSLMQSILGPQGARYRRLASAPLGPAGVTGDGPGPQAGP